jgi:hypothetical protein
MLSYDPDKRPGIRAVKFHAWTKKPFKSLKAKAKIIDTLENRYYDISIFRQQVFGVGNFAGIRHFSNL